jgi:hypothetical protein
MRKLQLCLGDADSKLGVGSRFVRRFQIIIPRIVFAL